MNANLMNTGIFGGVVVFFWQIISWMALPWHAWTYKKFISQSAVVNCLRENAPSSGIYVAEKGSLVFTSIDLNSSGGMSVFNFIFSLVFQIIAGFIIAWLLSQSKINNYMKRVGFVTGIGAVVAVLAYLPPWNWYHFSTAYTFVNFFDMIISWFLAGLVMAKYAKKSFL